LPTSLKDAGSVVLPHKNNYNYAGVTDAEDEVLRLAIENPENWVGRDDARFRLLLPGDGGSTGIMGSYSRWTMFIGMAIGVVMAAVL
jgi:hypothetical protein